MDASFFSSELVSKIEKDLNILQSNFSKTPGHLCFFPLLIHLNPSLFKSSHIWILGNHLHMSPFKQYFGLFQSLLSRPSLLLFRCKCQPVWHMQRNIRGILPSSLYSLKGRHTDLHFQNKNQHNCRIIHSEGIRNCATHILCNYEPNYMRFSLQQTEKHVVDQTPFEHTILKPS